MRNALFWITLLIVSSCAPARFGSTGQRIIEQGDGWEMDVIASGLNGADGVDLVIEDGVLHIASAWEQSGKATDSTMASTSIVASSISGAEDAKFCDVDQDGHQDVIVAGNHKLAIAFGGGGPVVTVSTAQRFLTTLCDPVNRRLYAGGYSTGASVGFFTAANWRTGPFPYTQIAPAAWIQTIAFFNGKLLVVDRDYIPGSPPNYAYRGISLYDLQTFARTVVDNLGNHKQATVITRGGVPTILATRSSASIRELSFIAWPGWEVTAILVPDAIGEPHSMAYCDLDLDGVEDILVSSAAAGAGLSGVVALLGPDFTQRIEVSGKERGTKFDNVVCADVDGDGDPDAVTTEETENLGVIAFKNPNVNAVIPPPEDAGCVCQ